MSLLPNMSSTTPTREFSKQDYQWMDRARILAGFSTERQKHGCVITQAGRMLATGINVFRNSPLNLTYPSVFASYHAEARAIKALHREHESLKRMTVYVARVNSRFEPMMSEPCNRCWEALEEIGVGPTRIIWTTGGVFDDGKNPVVKSSIYRSTDVL